jgi:arabinose-5-phosphate isomerase
MMRDESTDKSTMDVVLRVLRRESEAIDGLAARLTQGSALPEVVGLVHGCAGRVVFAGMGKMGAISRKAAATFASTGCPALFVQPSEALHGDLGMITGKDVFLALSYSGETDELIKVTETIRPWGVPIVAMTGGHTNSLAKLANFVLDISVACEAIDQWAVPSCSTTVALALCDALAVAVMERRGFTAADFAILHPGGSLGRRLRIRVADLMHQARDVPRVAPEQSLREAIVEMSRKSLGATLVVDDRDGLLGLLTDGDVRRTIQQYDNPLNEPVRQYMTQAARTCTAEWLAARALALMEEHRITVLPVTDAADRVVGIVHFHDLVRARLA